MANTLPGTPYVESSDLVANYPAASESLAERVDLVGILPFADSTARGTALPTPTDGQYSYLQDTNITEYWNGAAWVPAGAIPGLVHVNTTTFSAASSISVNNCFSSLYENYRIILSFVNSTGTENYIRLRASGTDNTASNYTYQRIFGFGSSTNALIEENITTWAIMPGTTIRNIGAIDMVLPHASATTGILNTGFRGNGAGVYGGYHTASTSFDGFTLYPGTGTLTGTMRIYGYQNS